MHVNQNEFIELLSEGNDLLNQYLFINNIKFSAISVIILSYLTNDKKKDYIQLLLEHNCSIMAGDLLLNNFNIYQHIPDNIKRNIIQFRQSNLCDDIKKHII